MVDQCRTVDLSKVSINFIGKSIKLAGWVFRKRDSAKIDLESALKNAKNQFLIDVFIFENLRQIHIFTFLRNL